jgi:hypothetical protein
MPANDAIDAFWQWWQTGRGRVEAAIASREFAPELIDEIGERISAMHEGFDWELGPGDQAQHAFCVSGKGNPELRVLAEVWKLRGPAPDATWEYQPARRGGAIRAGMRLEIGGFAVELADFVATFEVDTSRERIDASYFHAAFAEMDENLRGTTTFLMLDGAFGEDGVERWLGSIEVLTAPPEGARPIGELQRAVEELSRTATGEKFAIMKGQDREGNPLFFTINQALKRIDHLLCSMHVAIDLALLAPNEHGLTTKEEAEQLNSLEDELSRALGSGAVYFGRETRRGRRVLHWYAPEDSPAASIIERWTATQRARDPKVSWQRDPSWRFARGLG